MCEHQWLVTGKQAVHVEFPTKTEGRRSLFAIYLRCSNCKQYGFRRPNRRVIYTWDPNSENWMGPS